MEKMRQPTASELLGGTISDDLDRIEIRVGKIGMNTREQSIEVLHRLDDVSDKLKDMGTGPSQKVAVTQFETILAKLDKESAGFLRDLGGAHVLDELRRAENPPANRTWWYLDERLAGRRKASLRRTLIVSGVIVLAVIILGAVYQFFLAPSPEVAERYGHEQAARDGLMYGNLDDALNEVDGGLSYAPTDPALLILKGVILEKQGKTGEAEAIFADAQKRVTSPEDFYINRGQNYVMANDAEKALIDAKEALRLNPDSAQAYLLSGQVYETVAMFQMALDDYQSAYESADLAQQTELAALARMRMAMVMQSMNSSMATPPAWLVETLTPGQ